MVLLVLAAVLLSPLTLAGAANHAFASDSPTFCGLPAEAFASAVPWTECDDILVGTANADLIRGFGGNDQLLGNAGDDCLVGGDDNDVLYDEVGDDLINGGNGGNGADGCSDPMDSNKIVECEGP